MTSLTSTFPCFSHLSLILFVTITHVICQDQISSAAPTIIRNSTGGFIVPFVGSQPNSSPTSGSQDMKNDLFPVPDFVYSGSVTPTFSNGEYKNPSLKTNNPLFQTSLRFDASYITNLLSDTSTDQTASASITNSTVQEKSQDIPKSSNSNSSSTENKISNTTDSITQSSQNLKQPNNPPVVVISQNHTQLNSAISNKETQPTSTQKISSNRNNSTLKEPPSHNYTKVQNISTPPQKRSAGPDSNPDIQNKNTISPQQKSSETIPNKQLTSQPPFTGITLSGKYFLSIKISQLNNTFKVSCMTSGGVETTVYIQPDSRGVINITAAITETANSVFVAAPYFTSVQLLNGVQAFLANTFARNSTFSVFLQDSNLTTRGLSLEGLSVRIGRKQPSASQSYFTTSFESTVENLNVSVQGGCSFRGQNIRARKAFVNTYQDSSARVSVLEEATLSAYNKSRIFYQGASLKLNQHTDPEAYIFALP